MSELSYSKILDIVAEVLRKDADLKKIFNKRLTVEVEEGQGMPSSQKCPLARVSLDTWQSDPDTELIGGLNSLRTTISIKIEMIVYALQNKQGRQRRDELLTKVKEVFKKNRTLDGVVLITRFLGGDFDGIKGKKSGFFKAVSLNLEVEVRE